MSIFDKINRDKRRDERRLLKKERRAEKAERRRQHLMKRFGEGGIVIPTRAKYNRRLLLLTRLRRVK